MAIQGIVHCIVVNKLSSAVAREQELYYIYTDLVRPRIFFVFLDSTSTPATHGAAILSCVAYGDVRSIQTFPESLEKSGPKSPKNSSEFPELNSSTTILGGRG